MDLPNKEDVFGKASALTMKYQEENERIVQQLEENKVESSTIILYISNLQICQTKQENKLQDQIAARRQRRAKKYLGKDSK